MPASWTPSVVHRFPGRKRRATPGAGGSDAVRESVAIHQALEMLITQDPTAEGSWKLLPSWLWGWHLPASRSSPSPLFSLRRWFTESARWHATTGKMEKALAELRKVARINGRKEQGEKLSLEVRRPSAAPLWSQRTRSSGVSCSGVLG